MLLHKVLRYNVTFLSLYLECLNTTLIYLYFYGVRGICSVIIHHYDRSFFSVIDES